MWNHKMSRPDNDGLMAVTLVTRYGTLLWNVLTTKPGLRIQWIDLLHSNIYHFHLFIRFIVSRVCRHIAYFLSDIHSLHNTSKDSVFVIKPRLKARKIQGAFKNRACMQGKWWRTWKVNQCMRAAKSDVLMLHILSRYSCVLPRNYGMTPVEGQPQQYWCQYAVMEWANDVKLQILSPTHTINI